MRCDTSAKARMAQGREAARGLAVWVCGGVSWAGALAPGTRVRPSICFAMTHEEKSIVATRWCWRRPQFIAKSCRSNRMAGLTTGGGYVVTDDGSCGSIVR